MEDKEPVKRDKWGRQLDFLLSLIGFAVGLGNVWRFPYLAYRNGGATFVLPYIIMLVIAGLPLLLMELSLGQFASQGPLTIWTMSPFFAGIGYAMVIICAIVCIYYNVIIAYAIYYMMVSFVYLDDSLPWSTCQNWWNSAHCRDTPFPNFASMNETEAWTAITEDLYNDECLREQMRNQEVVANISAVYPDVSNYSTLNSTLVRDLSGWFTSCRKSFSSPAQDYWNNFVLRLPEAENIGSLGGISLKLILTLALAWLLIFVCLLKGVKSSGKVVYFTALFPYVILIVLFARGITLPGHLEGIYFYVIPTWSKLADSKVWSDAATQIFYSMGIGFGSLLTMASYNKFNHNCYRDAILVGLADAGTSVFSGFVIFSLLGHMAFITNQNVQDVADSGPGLAFVAYPEGISKLPAQSLWAFLFFGMILTLGLDSQFAMMETVISGISDLFPRLLRKRKALFTFLMCLTGFLLGIPQTTKGGVWVLTLMDWYSGNYNLMIVALCELTCLMYVYGFRNFCRDIEMMLGFKPNIYWLATWLLVAPASILFIIISGAIRYTKAYYGGYEFENFAQGIGWMMVALPLVAIVIVAIIQMIRYGVPKCFMPLPEWGPDDDENRTDSYAPDAKSVPGLVDFNSFDNLSFINSREFICRL